MVFVLVLQLRSSGQLMKTGAFGNHCILDLRGCHMLSLCKYWKKDRFEVFYECFLFFCFQLHFGPLVVLLFPMVVE